MVSSFPSVFTDSLYLTAFAYSSSSTQTYISGVARFPVLNIFTFLPFNHLLTSSSCMTLNTIYPLVNFKFISPALSSPTNVTVIFKWPFNISYASQMSSNLGPLPTSPNISPSLQLFHLCDGSGQIFVGIWNLFLLPHLTSNPSTIVYMVQYLKYN